ncbi:hypothetical protein H8M03_02550 [Sphingomonas sabuli]|uniref:Uncharacterized protein n=1 Tax=Sphingomonas sabuli TaxID=2764186 RepID=A0A7G9L3Q0_9SPHN|nr:hypothetical protein [Sphingomonas sabuli]QNM83249.1 hypothetical protein H8M03_02550 [Sphingomonas sabuli]
MARFASAQQVASRFVEEVAERRAEPMSVRLRLYRSVSVPELEDILCTGAIVGGQNRFNTWDTRPFVFFADELTDHLIAQGEASYRQAYFASMRHELYDQIDRLASRIERLADLALAELDYAGARYDPEAAELFRHGIGSGHFRRAARRARSSVAIAASKEVARLNVHNEQLWADHSRLVETLVPRIEQLKAGWRFTSAVLVTKPVGGGIRYPGELGICGLPGHSREYAFQPGQIGAADIERIILFKNHREIASIEDPTCALGLSRAFPCRR